MEEDLSEVILEKEQRLQSTLMTQKPAFSGLMAALITLMFMAIFSQIYWLDIYGWSSQLPAVRTAIFDNSEWWRVFTAIFIHGDVGHFTSNMLMLSVFSFFVFGHFGFGAYPLFAFIFAGLTNLLAVATYGPEVRLLGASGLVYLLGGFWLTLYFFIQRQYAVWNRLIRVTGLALMLFFPTTFSPTTSYRTHAIGIVMGVFMGIFYFYKNKKSIRSKEVYRIDYV